jgi:hypothetical protein
LCYVLDITRKYLTIFYKKNPSLSKEPYEKQMETIIEDCFVSWGAMQNILKDMIGVRINNTELHTSSIGLGKRK